MALSLGCSSRGELRWPEREPTGRNREWPIRAFATGFNCSREPGRRVLGRRDARSRRRPALGGNGDAAGGDTQEERSNPPGVTSVSSPRPFARYPKHVRHHRRQEGHSRGAFSTRRQLHGCDVACAQATGAGESPQRQFKEAPSRSCGFDPAALSGLEGYKAVRYMRSDSPAVVPPSSE